MEAFLMLLDNRIQNADRLGSADYLVDSARSRRIRDLCQAGGRSLAQGGRCLGETL